MSTSNNTACMKTLYSFMYFASMPAGSIKGIRMYRMYIACVLATTDIRLYHVCQHLHAAVY